MPGWISHHAMMVDSIRAPAIQKSAVTTEKVDDTAITVEKLDPELLSYFLPFLEIDVGVIDFSLIE